MSATVQVRPNNWTYATGLYNVYNGSLPSMWADNNDDNYLYFIGGGGEIGVGFEVYNLAGKRCAGARLGLRVRSAGLGDFSLDTWLRPATGGDGGGGWYYGAYLEHFTNFWNGWWSREFTQNDLNNMQAQFRNNNAGGSTAEITEAYVEYDIRTQPTATITAPANGSANHPLRPTVTWNNNFQGDSARSYQIDVRRNSDWHLAHTATIAGFATSYQIPVDLTPGTAYTIHVRISTNFLGTDWWSNWSTTSITIDPVPSAVISTPSGTITTTNAPDITWVYGGSIHPQSHYELKVFTSADYTNGGFNPDIWPAVWPSTPVQVASSANSASMGTNLIGGVTYKVYIRVKNAVSNTWSVWQAGPAFSILAAGVDRPARVFFGYSGAPGQGAGYYEFDDTKREGQFIWKSAPFRETGGGRQVEIREVQVYCQTYDGGASIAVQVGNTTRTVTFPIPGRHHAALLFKERGEMLDVQITSTAGNILTGEAPTIEAVRIGKKAGHQLPNG